MTKVAVIIPTLASKETRPYLKLCVESLRATTDWDIIVVSNGTNTGEPLTDIKGITLRLHTRDQGQNNAVNIGAQVANADYLLVSNDDMYYAPGWNKNLKFDKLCFSPNLVEPINNNGSAKPFLKLDGGLTLEEFRKKEVDKFVGGFVPPRIRVTGTNQNDEVVSEEYEHMEEPGFNLPFFIRKDVFTTIGGYDVAFDPWGSNGDTDLQTKVELAGITPMRLRDVLVYHFSNKSGTFDGTHQEFWQHNWDYYTQKWGFNRDDTGGDPWYCTNMIDYDRLKYKPEWAGKYKND